MPVDENWRVRNCGPNDQSVELMVRTVSGDWKVITMTADEAEALGQQLHEAINR